MMPYMCGSMFNAFRSLPYSFAVEFFIVVAYIALFELILFGAETTAKRMTAEPFTICFVFPIQFFQYFYSALFFINLGLDSGLFWATLVLQSFWLAFRNSGFAKDLGKFVFEKFTIKFKQVTGRDFFFQQVLEVELQRVIQQIQQATQYLVCDAIVLVSVPVQFQVWSYFLREKQGIPYVTCYAKFYNLTYDETFEGELIKRFAVIFAFKLFFHIIAQGVLAWKVRRFNLKYDTKIRLFGASTAFLRAQLAFIIVISISIQRLCYSIRSSLANSDLTVDFSGCVTGNATNVGQDSTHLYWDYVILDIMGVS